MVSLPLLTVLVAAIRSTSSMPLITLPNTAKPLFGPRSKRALSLTLIKNWLVALLGSFVVQAIETLPRVLLGPFLASFLIGRPVARSSRSMPSPPPWM
jgi:hypothetical protein